MGPTVQESNWKHSSLKIVSKSPSGLTANGISSRSYWRLKLTDESRVVTILMDQMNWAAGRMVVTYHPQEQ